MPGGGPRLAVASVRADEGPDQSQLFTWSPIPDPPPPGPNPIADPIRRAAALSATSAGSTSKNL